MNKPIVSVIMPAYNGEKYIGEAINSILAQTFQEWELIIIEDCSSDHTLSIIEKYLTDERIKLLKNENNIGIASTRNKAIDMSKGKYIAIQDDDDLSLSDRFEKQVCFLEKHPDIDAVAGCWMIVDETGEHILGLREGYQNPRYVKASLLFSDCIGNGTAMIRRDFLQKHKLRYHDNMLGMEDFLFWIEFSKQGNISAVDSIVYKHRRHSAQETEKCRQEMMIQERRTLYAKLQRKSLQLSGIILSEKATEALERLAGEKTDPTLEASDYLDLYNAFIEIISQVYAKKLDNAEEIAIACRKFLGKKIANSKGFWNHTSI